MAKQLMKYVSLCLLAMFAFSASGFAEDLSNPWVHVFSTTDKTFTEDGTVNLSGVEWTLAVDWGTSSSDYNKDATDGMKIGSNTKAPESMTLTSSADGFPGTITSVKVTAKARSKALPHLTVTVGGTTFKYGDADYAEVASSATEYEFTGSGSGSIVVKYEHTGSTKGAFYVKQLEVAYSTSGMEKVKTPVITPADGSKFTTESQEVTITTETEGATIIYTLNGGAEQTYTAPFDITETTTIAAYATKDGMDNSSTATATITKKDISDVIVAADFDDLTERSSSSFNYENDYGTWVGEKMSREVGFVKLGSSSANGSVTTPKSDAFTSNAVLTYKAKRYDSSTTINVEILGGGEISGDVNITNLGADFAEYTVNITGATADTQLKLSGSPRVYVDDIVIRSDETGGGETVAVASPSFSVSGGKYYAPIELSLSCSTEGASIYYTLDGTEPSSASTAYTSAINISETTTVKAIAVSGDNTSDVASATYTFPTTVANIAGLAGVTSGEDVILTLADAQVLYVNGTNDVYIKDATGAMDFFKSGLSFNAGQILNGTIIASNSPYNGIYEIKPISGKTNLDNVTITEGEATPVVMTTAEAAESSAYCQLVTIKDVVPVADGTKFYTDDTKTVQIYNKFGVDYSLDESKKYNITGVIITFSSGGNIVSEIAPTIVPEEVVSPEEVGFRDIKADLTQLQALATESDVYIAVAEDGTISQTDNAENAAATLKGTWHGPDYGWSNFTASVPVEGTVKITYATHDYGNDIVVTNDAGETVATLNTNGAKWSSNHDNVVSTYYRVNEPTTLHFSNANYNPYFAVEAIDPADIPAEVTKYNVTFAAGDATGVAPTALEVESGGSVKLPKNYTLYKEGYTLTGWSDGNETYEPGAQITPSADMALTPVFTANTVSLADRTADVEVVWQLGESNTDNAPYNFNGTTGIIVTQATVNGVTIDVKADVDGTAGKLVNTGRGDKYAQVNPGAKITVPSCKGATVCVNAYAAITATTINGVVGSSVTVEDDVKSVDIVDGESGQYFISVSSLLPYVSDEPEEVNYENVEAMWDFVNNCANLAPKNEGGELTASSIASNVEGISLKVVYNGGKVKNNDNSYQVTNGVVFQIPVKTVKDTIIVVGYPGYCSYTIGDKTGGAGNETVTYKASSADVERGYAELASTSDNNYINTITLKMKSGYEEKGIYSTDFTDWTQKVAHNKDEVITGTETVTTRYTNETLTFTYGGVDVLPEGYDSKVKDYTGFIKAYKYNSESAENGYIETTKLANVTKVHFIHGATGSNRGFKLLAKSEGDETWTEISTSVANPSSGCVVDAEVNMNNCYLRFENLSPSNYAFLLEMTIYGMVDMSKSPILESFKANGTEYIAGDIFTMNQNGNYEATIELKKTEAMVSADNPLTDVVAANGEVGDITYAAEGDKGIATIPVTANGTTANYIATFEFKPDFTLKYFNTDGSEMGTQTVEKDAKIGEFAVDYNTATAEEGEKVRGWFISADGGRKITTEEVITADLNLYAVATEIEGPSNDKRYFYDLTVQYFYPEDHEAFNPEGNGHYYNNHGWVFVAGDKINLLVGSHAFIILGQCAYSADAAVTFTDANDNELGTIASAKASKDGRTSAFEYTGEPGVVTVKFNGTYYLHTLTINNVANSPYTQNGDWYTIEAGNADKFLATLDIINSVNSADDASRKYIFLPDGNYDFGNICLTSISGNNISIIGQSTEHTIIENSPKAEGIAVTATLLNTSNNLYMQDLTLKNNWYYYGIAGDGRGVCLQDKGNNTVCKNVRMLSYQDTYYTNNAEGNFYWEDSEIHGTVDFICGEGTLFMENSKLFVEKRNADGTGECTITAPSTKDGKQYGYVFNNCTIENEAESFNFGRAWNNKPRAAYLNTTIINDKLISTRWRVAGMNNNNPVEFVEYKSVDESGSVISPESNVVTFTNAGGVTMETILTDAQAANFTLDKVFADWAPAEFTVQMDAPDAEMTEGVITWTPNDDAIAYALFKNDELLGITTETSFDTNTDSEAHSAPRKAEGDDVYTIRAANAHGGFGEAKTIEVATGIENVSTEKGNVVSTTYYNVAGARVSDSAKGVLLKVEKLENGKTVTTKVVR